MYCWNFTSHPFLCPHTVHTDTPQVIVESIYCEERERYAHTHTHAHDLRAPLNTCGCGLSHKTMQDASYTHVLGQAVHSVQAINITHKV